MESNFKERNVQSQADEKDIPVLQFRGMSVKAVSPSWSQKTTDSSGPCP